MKQKLPWIVAAVLGVTLLGCVIGLVQARTARNYATEQANAAQAENQNLLAAKKQTDAQLAAAQTALTVATKQADEQKNAKETSEAEQEWYVTSSKAELELRPAY